MSKSWDCDQGKCRIQINNILVCSGKNKKYTDEYEVDKDIIKNLRDDKEYKLDKKGVTIINKLSCGKCCSNDNDDEDDND